MTNDQEPIPTVDTDREAEIWDGVTCVIYAAEKQCPPDDYAKRLEVARRAIGEPWRAFDLHDPACPKTEGQACCCGLVSVFTNDRWVAYVDMFHTLQTVHAIH